MSAIEINISLTSKPSAVSDLYSLQAIFGSCCYLIKKSDQNDKLLGISTEATFGFR